MILQHQHFTNQNDHLYFNLTKVKLLQKLTYGFFFLNYSFLDILEIKLFILVSLSQFE